ncbi:30S ribosomal protein S5 [Sesbania bispinosa]|nr:30S ribosomal protein S5 [Sesbania bispinosa]
MWWKKKEKGDRGRARCNARSHFDYTFERQTVAWNHKANWSNYVYKITKGSMSVLGGWEMLFLLSLSTKREKGICGVKYLRPAYVLGAKRSKIFSEDKQQHLLQCKQKKSNEANWKRQL